MMKAYIYLGILLFIGSNYTCSGQKENQLQLNKVYPWCIVAFDSLKRSPNERIAMLMDLGFNKYAYDWRDEHLTEMQHEINLARDNDIEIISVWLWLNAKRDSLNVLSPANERIFEILKESKLETRIWLSFSNNFFEDLTQEESMSKAIEMIEFVNSKAEETGCQIALYNHKGWFGDTANQVKIIGALPHIDLSIVYNFHHGHEDLENFPEVVKNIKPYLSAVNLNGMRKDGPEILQIGVGDYESEMIRVLIEEGFNGPWGILGHVEDEDVRKILKGNMKGLNSLNL